MGTIGESTLSSTLSSMHLALYHRDTTTNKITNITNNLPYTASAGNIIVAPTNGYNFSDTQIKTIAGDRNYLRLKYNNKEAVFNSNAGETIGLDVTYFLASQTGFGGLGSYTGYLDTNHIDYLTPEIAPSVKYGNVDITGTLKNCTCNYNNGTTIEENKPIIITANTGYTFTDTGDWYLQDGSGSLQKFTNNGSNLTFTISDLTDTYTLTQNYEAVQETTPSNYIIIKNNDKISNVHCGLVITENELASDYDVVEFDKQITKSGYFLWLGETGYEFNSTPTDTPVLLDEKTGTQYPFEYKQFHGVGVLWCGTSTAKFKSNGISELLLSSKSGNAITIEPEKQTTFGYVETQDAIFQNCTCNFENQEHISDTKKTILITANNGYEFNAVTGTMSNSGAAPNDFTISDDKKTLTYKITQTNLNYFLHEAFTADAVTVETLHFCNLYKVNDSILNSLSNERFKELSTDDLFDYGQFIYLLYYYPLKLSAEMIGNESQIILANLRATTKAPIINQYLHAVELGDVIVPTKYNNAYDFLDTTCVLHVPFFDTIILEPEYVIGHKISCTLYIDLYTNKCTLDVKSDFNNNTIYNAQTNIGTEIPFVQNNNRSFVSNINTTYYNKISSISIDVMRNIPYQYNMDIFGEETKEVTTLENKTGFIQVDKITLETKATETEQNSIVSLLENGIEILEVS